MKSKLSISQRIRNARSSQLVENVKARHGYYHTKGQGAEEFSTLWSQREDVSWAHCFGRMRGFDEIWWDSVTRIDAMAYSAFTALAKKYPQVGGKDPRALFEAPIHTLTTDVLEVAEDGMSARATFFTPGVIFNHLALNGKHYARCNWEVYGADFVYENGEWLYLHEHVCPILGCRVDIDNWAAISYRCLADPEYKEYFMKASAKYGDDDVPFGEMLELRLADAETLHSTYSPILPPQDTVPWPEPYATLDDNNTYTRPVLK